VILVEKNNFCTHVYSTPSLKVIPAECRNANSDKKTRVMGQPGGETSEMICTTVLAQYQSVTDRQTDRQTDSQTDQHNAHITSLVSTLTLDKMDIENKKINSPK